jgi:dTDP-3-amino-3,4,6-trideoxy-alpha-D-glucose transaminase
MTNSDGSTGPRPIRFLDLSAAYGELKTELDAAYARVMAGGWWVGGSEVEAFERDFAAYCGTACCAGVGNGLDALSIILRSLGVGPGDEVVVPAHTFIATWLAVTSVGATPVAAEPAPGRYNLALETAAPLLTPRTRAIIVVHLYGEPVVLEPIAKLARDNGIALIEDAAQAHGARRNGVAVGAVSDAAAFSFYPGKNLGAFGDGGAIVTDDKDLHARALRIRNYGALRKHEHEIAGVNSRLDALQAAFLSVRLKHLDTWNERRRRIAELYAAELDGLGDLILPRAGEGNTPAWHLYVCATGQRDALRDHLATAGIETAIHYPRPVYRTPAFAAFGPAERTPSDEIADRILSLPMGPHLSSEQAQSVIAAIRRFFA